MTISNVQAVLETQSKWPAAEAATAPTGSRPAHLQSLGRLLSTGTGLYCDAKQAQQLTLRCCSAGQDPRKLRAAPRRQATTAACQKTKRAQRRDPMLDNPTRVQRKPQPGERRAPPPRRLAAGLPTRPETTLSMRWPDPVVRRVWSLLRRLAAAPGRGCRGTDGSARATGPARATGRVHSGQGPPRPGPAHRPPTGPTIRDFARQFRA